MSTPLPCWRRRCRQRPTLHTARWMRTTCPPPPPTLGACTSSGATLCGGMRVRTGGTCVWPCGQARLWGLWRGRRCGLQARPARACSCRCLASRGTPASPPSPSASACAWTTPRCAPCWPARTTLATGGRTACCCAWGTGQTCALRVCWCRLRMQLDASTPKERHWVAPSEVEASTGYFIDAVPKHTSRTAQEGSAEWQV
mmetsp:Transcript_6832/g.17201  ORF Transcript_6832/g.17201 Transcript_6832/m.17201 type:complete len:200 (+) Transcript_6832:178-777(+)